MRGYGYLAMVTALGLGCSGNSSLGNDRGASTVSGGAGGSDTSTGGSSATAGADTSGTGGSTPSGGSSAGGTASMTGGGTAGSGNSGGTAGTAGTAGTGATGAGGGRNPDPKVAVDDPDTTGDGPCANVPLSDVIDGVHAGWPDLADIDLLYQPDLVGVSQAIYAFTSDAGFSLVFFRGAGDCPAGCIDRYYWYFTTNESCEPIELGHFSQVFDSSGNCMRVDGEPRWSIPDPPSPTSVCGDIPPGLNEACVDDACPTGLTPVKFYGVAGTSGPEFCWCSIDCAGDPGVCPNGTICTSLPDGPQNICYEN